VAEESAVETARPGAMDARVTLPGATGEARAAACDTAVGDAGLLIEDVARACLSVAELDGTAMATAAAG